MMFFSHRKPVFIIVCSIVMSLMAAGLLVLFYLIMSPNAIMLNHDTEAKPLVVPIPVYRRDADIWKKTIEQDLKKLNSKLEKLWCKLTQTQSNGGFCITEQQLSVGGNEVFDVELCSAVESLAGNGSVGDLGAGLGWYGMCLLRLKEVPFLVNPKLKAEFNQNYLQTVGEKHKTPQVVSSWDGFDGAGNIEELSDGFVRQVDLAEEGLWLGRQWEWVMSVEVGEHIAARHEKVFLDNIVRHACKGVLLTWAVVGQGGHNHINERGNDYIKARMEERGLINDIKEEKRIRPLMKLGWLTNTVMVFRFPEQKKCNVQ